MTTRKSDDSHDHGMPQPDCPTPTSDGARAFRARGRKRGFRGLRGGVSGGVLAGGLLVMAAGAIAGIMLPGSQRPLALVIGADGGGADAGEDSRIHFDTPDEDVDEFLPVVDEGAAAPMRPGSQRPPAPVAADPEPEPEADAGAATPPAAGGYSIAIAKPDAVIGGSGRTFYVDYDNGRDSNAGTSTSSPWKHAPGDTAATGKSASMALKPGDTVRLKGGVHYRGAFTLKQSGTASAPIIYTGTGYGSGHAIWDGADPVTSAAKCPSQSACGGAAAWRNLWLVRYAEPQSGNAKVHDEQGPLFEAMTPAKADAFWNKNLSEFLSVPLSQASQLASGRLTNATLAAVARNEPGARLAIWVQGNRVVERAIHGITGNTILFDPDGVKPYTDRSGRAAVVGAVRSVTAPGLYARLGAGQAVVWPRTGGGKYFVGTGRSGFNLGSQSNIVIHGIHFIRGTSTPGSTREAVVLANYGSKQSSNIRFEGNAIRNFAMLSGYGAIQLDRVSGLVVRGNVVENIEDGSGMRFGGSVTDLVVEGNSVRRVGRTGIYLPSVQNAVVRGNIISEILGVHGNAMSYYLGHRNVTVIGNCVFNSSRPLTFHGNGASGPVANLQIRHNIFVSTPEDRAGIYSWGKNTREVRLENNFALGRKAGIILSAADQGVVVTGNRTSGIIVASGGGATPPGWSVRGNDTTAHLDDARAATLSQSYCQAQGLDGPISIRIDS